MKKHTFLSLLIIFAVVFSISAKASKETQDVNPQMRIITLAPNMTELVCALGCSDNLVGISNSCTLIEECPCKTTVGDMWKPSVETIVSLEPTIVIASSLTDDSIIKALTDAGINTVKINYDQRLEGTYSLITEVGKCVGKEEKAQNIAENIRKRIEEVASKTKNITEKKSVVYIISFGNWGDYAATGDTFIGDVILKAGGVNAAQSASYWAISKELLLAEDPDVIIIPTYSYMTADIDGFKNTEPYSSLTGDVITINGDMAERQGLNTADFVEKLAKILYPELF